MKDYANPLLLLIILALLSWKVSLGIETPSAVEIWLLTLCVTGVIVNGLLALARAMAQRKAFMAVVWSAVYLVVCSGAWVTLRQEKGYRAEIAAYNELNIKWQDEGKDPFSLYDEEGRSLLELAAILGRKTAVRGLLAQPEAAKAPEVIMKSAISAAENGRHELLRILAQHKELVNFNTLSDGRTPLIAAVLNNNKKCVDVLLQLQADPNTCDENGVSPLMHAVINNQRGIARKLIDYGANPRLKDRTERDAFSCSRTEEMDEVLNHAK